LEESESPTPVQACLDRLAAGDSAARDELIRLSRDRVLLMVRAMLRRYRGLRRWEESDDVVQNVLIRLHHTLSAIQFKSTRDFLAIAATNVRWELIDLARHYYGRSGLGANHATPPEGRSGRRTEEPAADDRVDPAVLAECVELHQHIAALPEEDREVFDLHWYHGLTQKEVAALLGVSPRTVRRRWVAAKIRLASVLGYGLPGQSSRIDGLPPPPPSLTSEAGPGGRE
jgi:RNA polymerase sigma factor (sigma-70 family)